MSRWSWMLGRLLPVIGVVLVAGCGGGSGSGGDTPTPTPTQKRIVLVTYGSTGILWAGSLSTSCDEIKMVKNALTTLAQRETGVRVLYASDSGCNPRTDPAWCHLVSESSRLAPFFSMIDSIGTIDFKAYSSVDPYAYDVVILDTCRTNTESIKTSIQSYIDHAAHGGMLILGTNVPGCSASVQRANSIIQGYGMTLTSEDPQIQGCHAIAADKRTGLLKDVTQLDFFRIVPQTLTLSAKSVYEDATARPLMSYYERNVTP
jgi:hypothetical protein